MIGTRAAARLCGLVAVATITATGSIAQTTSYVPAKPVRIVVAFPAGGAADLTGRLIAQKLGEEWHQTVVVENQGGANGNVGAEYVSRAAPDGATLLVASPGVFTTNRFLYKAMPFDPEKSLSPVSLAIVSPNILVMNPDFPAADLPALIVYARANPGKVQYASQGNGSTAHLSGALMAQTAGIEMGHVPYRGDAPALNDVIAGHVPIMWNSIGSVLPYIQAGKLKALASGSATRATSLPDVPTAAEAGLGLESVSWFAVAAPGGTPKPIVEALSQAIARALKSPDIQARFADLGAQAVGGSPAELRDFSAAETAKWQVVIEKAAIKPE